MNGRSVSTKFSGGAARTSRAVALIVALGLFAAQAAGQTVTGSSFNVNSRDVAAVGLVPGQTLRITVFNPGETAQSGESKPIQIKVGLLNNRGELLYETAEADIPAGGFHSFDIRREDITAAGEPRTGRLQVRVELVIEVARGRDEGGDTSRGQTTVVQGTLELIDNDSGKTAIGLLLPAIQKVREAAARN